MNDPMPAESDGGTPTTLPIQPASVFPRIDYLHWIGTRPAEAAHDLGTTNQQLGDPLERVPGHHPPESGCALQERLAAELAVEPSNLLVTAGATHANFLAMATALAGEAEEVLVESPGYEPHSAHVEGFGATVRTFARRAADGFALSPERIAAKLTPSTALVAVTDRHNPSGRRTSSDRLEAIAEAAAENDARLLVDEVYAPFTSGTASDPNFGGGTVAGVPGTVVTGSLTKFLGLGDLRIGWLVADEPFVHRAREVSAHVPTVAGVSKRLARSLLSRRAEEVATARARAKTNAKQLANFVESRDDLTGTVHGSCPFAFPTHTERDGDELANAAWEAGIYLVPGRFFGAPDRFRIAAATDPEKTAAGLSAFGSVLDKL